jgi:hypothetical protein
MGVSKNLTVLSGINYNLIFSSEVEKGIVSSDMIFVLAEASY